MDEITIYWSILIASAVIALAIFILLLYISAPYGRHIRKGWGPSIQSKWGWIIMESPTVIVVSVLYALSDYKLELVPIVFLVLWLLHYVQRDLIFPFFLRTKKRMPVLIMLFGLIFNFSNSYLQARWIFHFARETGIGPQYNDNWLLSAQFIAGVIIFILGYIINRHSDVILRDLRKPGENGYKIPFGGMYKFISSPNYFGEILIWVGWALMVWNWAGLLFAFWTMANLVPRAISHHKWYKETFEDYPEKRKAIIPYLF